ncbi:MAG: hypothetical protein AB7P37_05390 [Ramlibacter sp.]
MSDTFSHAAARSTIHLITSVLVDLAAQTQEPLVRWMEDSGVLDMRATAASGPRATIPPPTAPAWA